MLDMPRSRGTSRSHGADGRPCLEVATWAGDIVESMDPLVILETMKKQIPVPSEVAGSSHR